MRNVLVAASTAVLLMGCAARRPHQPEREVRGARGVATSQEADTESLMVGDRPQGVRSAVTPERGLKTPRAAVPVTGVPGVADEGVFRAARARARADSLRIHLLNIGAGSCHIIECPNSSDVILYDCGQMYESGNDLSAQEIVDYFADVVGADNPAVVLSHADTDHVNRVAQVMAGRAPEVVLLGGDIDDYRGAVADFIESVPDGKLRFDWEPGWDEDGTPIPELNCGNADVYMGTVNVGTTTNSQSLTLIIQYEDFKVVFTGDAVGVTEESMLLNHPNLLSDVTVLLASHHGSHTNGSNGTHENNSTWAQVTSPEIVVYSAGATPHGHPRKIIVEPYQTSLLEVAPHDMWFWLSTDDSEQFTSELAEYATHLVGTVVIESDGESIDVSCSLDDACF